MKTGDRVVCVNDQFPALHRQVYQHLPVKGHVYTVRSVYVGRSHVAPSSPGESDGEIGLLLREIRNQDHEARFSRSGAEPGFSSQRFAPVVTQDEEVTREKEEPVIVAVAMPKNISTFPLQFTQQCIN